MRRDSLLEFLGTGMAVLPVVMFFGTGSIDAVACALFALLMLQIGVLMSAADDPIGDKLRAEKTRNKDEPPD